MVLERWDDQREFVDVLNILLFPSFVGHFDRHLRNLDVDEEFILLRSFLKNSKEINLEYLI